MKGISSFISRSDMYALSNIEAIGFLVYKVAHPQVEKEEIGYGENDDHKSGDLG